MKLRLDNRPSNDPRQWVIWYADILMTCAHWDPRMYRTTWAFTSYESAYHEDMANGQLLQDHVSNHEIAEELIRLATEHNAFTGIQVRMWFEVIGAVDASPKA